MSVAGVGAKPSSVGAAPPALVVSAGVPRTQIIDNTTATTQQAEDNQNHAPTAKRSAKRSGRFCSRIRRCVIETG
jgi:hypothetical protein